MGSALLQPPTAPSAQDSHARALEAVKRVTTLATLPEVTARIVSTVEDPRSTAAQLHKIISHDPALVTRILKIVNSAFYGLPGQIGSVERAIVLLGLNAVKNISVAASLGQMFRGTSLCDGYSAKDLWRHCIAVAVTARDLAKQLKLPMADEAFLSGMIHDVGILISLQLWPERLRQVCDRVVTTGADFCETERELTGFDHQALGAALAESWKFPSSCQIVAGYHHRPEALGGENRVLLAVVYVADVLAARAKQGFPLTSQSENLDGPWIAEAGISQELIDRTFARIPELVNSAGALLA